MSNDDWFSQQDKDCTKEILRTALNNLNALRDCDHWHDSDVDTWSEGAVLFQKVHRYVDRLCIGQKRKRQELPETVKDICVDAWIGDYYCRLHALRLSGPETLEYDSHRIIRKDISLLETEIKSYWILHERIWNTLQNKYDQWSEEWRTQGWKEEADELQSHMLQARMKYRLWVLAPRLVGRGGRWLQKRELERRKKVSRSLAQQSQYSGRRLSLVTQNWGIRFFDALRAWLEYRLFRIGKGLLSPLLVYVALPIFIFGLLYTLKGWVCIDRGGEIAALPPRYRFWYSLLFSTLVFTGSEPGQLTSCPGHAGMYTLMAIESLGAFIIIAVIIGYLVNRLSSR